MRMKVTYLLLLLLLAGQMATTACTSSSSRVREAERIIAIADSMDAEHQLYSDTVALRAAIRTLRKPIARHFHRNTLAAAYYYMGRNLEDNCSLIPDAADCYIACDRLHPDDPIRRRRVNACMAYICSQQSEDSLALVFRQRSTEAFRESGDTARYTYGLLFLSENYCQLGEYQIADSLWREAQTFPLDSAHYACLLETRGIYFYDRQQYDSALTCFLQVLNVPRGEEYKCFDYMKIAQIYESINKSAQAYPYAEYIVRHSANPYLISNAYYTLIKHSKQADDIELVASYSHDREDAHRECDNLTKAYYNAMLKCQNHLIHPRSNNRYWEIIVGCILSLCVLFLVMLLIYNKRKSYELSQTQQQLVSLQIYIEKERQLQQEDFIQKRQAVEETLNEVSSLFAFDSTIWKDYKLLCHTANQNMYNIVHRLKQSYNVDQQDILICLLTLYQAPGKVTADKIERSGKSISKLKSITAKILGTTAPQLRDFLIDFMAK